MDGREREQESFSQRNRFPAENNGRLKGSAPMDQRMDDSVGGMEGSLDKDLSSLPSAIGKPERERESGGPKHLGSQWVSFVGAVMSSWSCRCPQDRHHTTQSSTKRWSLLSSLGEEMAAAATAERREHDGDGDGDGWADWTRSCT
jgi:hypothetical protein